jgi:hypothetical protein
MFTKLACISGATPKKKERTAYISWAAPKMKALDAVLNKVVSHNF